MKEKKIKSENNYFPITWITFRKNCVHFEKGEPESYPIIHNCYHRINTAKRPLKTKTALTPEICNVYHCPVFKWFRNKSIEE